jgi:hypothetical protein
MGHTENHSNVPAVLSHLVGIGRVNRAPGSTYALHHAIDAASDRLCCSPSPLSLHIPERNPCSTYQQTNCKHQYMGESPPQLLTLYLQPSTTNMPYWRQEVHFQQSGVFGPHTVATQVMPSQ